MINITLIAVPQYPTYDAILFVAMGLLTWGEALIVGFSHPSTLLLYNIIYCYTIIILYDRTYNNNIYITYNVFRKTTHVQNKI